MASLRVSPQREHARSLACGSLWSAVGAWLFLLALPVGGAAPLSRVDLLGAVELALLQDPNIALAETRETAALAALLIREGRFDPVLQTDLVASHQRVPETLERASEVERLQTTTHIEQELRSGLLLRPTLELSQNRPQAAAGTETAGFSFEIRQPLLRDRGRSIVTAAERAAERELAAARLDREHTISQRALAVVRGFWDLEAARRQLEILLASEASSRELLATTRRLIEADLTPAAEVVLLEADLAAKEGASLRGQQDELAARYALAREIGLDLDPAVSSIFERETFPTLAPEDLPPISALESFLLAALAGRADLLAQAERTAASAVLELAATNGLQPRLDLTLTPSYDGLRSDGGESFPGPSVALGLAFLWPTRNREAEGLLLTSQAARRTSELTSEQLAREIRTGVGIAFDAVRASSLRVAKARVAVGLFERSVENEERKLKAGRSTLIDVIAQRDRLTSAFQQELSARLDLARALTELRFETGTLLVASGGTYQVRRERLTTLPLLEGNR